MKAPSLPEATPAFENLSASATVEFQPRQEAVPPAVADTLEESESSFRFLFEASPQPMWIFDSETLRFLLVNQAATEHYGYSQDEFLALTLMDIRPSEDVPSLLTAMSSPMPSKGRRGAWRHKKKDGRIIDVEIAGNNLNFRGKTARLGLVSDVTERKQAEATLHHIMEGAHCLLWQAEVVEFGEKRLQWNLQFASEQAAQRFLPLHVPEGKSYGDVWRLSRPEEDTDRTDLFGSQETRAGRSYQQEFRCHSKSGALHWLSEDVRVETLGEGKWRCIGVCTDITERKHAEEAARAMTRGAQCLLWYAFVEEQPHGLQWYIETVDEEAAKQFFPVLQPPEMSYTEASVRARHLEDNPVMDARATEALHNGKQGYTNQFRSLRADGEWRWLNETVRVEALTPGRWRCVGVCTDITEQKRTEEERDRFFLAKLEADAANEAKSEFLSRMSHELRTPLNAILGFGQILDKQTLTPLQRESVQYILKGGRHLLDLINEVLDIARVEAGHIELSLEPIPVSEMVCESCALVHPLAAERHISVDVNTTSFGRSHVLADRQRLKQALINLLSNAIKYNHSGGQARVYSLPRPNDRLAIAVQDTGLGITVEDQLKLFTPFERLNAARSGVEGTGLGLVTAQRLVTAMGGSLTLQSLPGEGTTFCIELPLVPSPVETLANRPRSVCELKPDASLEQRATVLYIEDNLSNMRLLEVLLRTRPGITLLTAMQGSLGLDLARQHAPDLILLDLNLPDFSGREVLARLQASALTRDIPVIVLSADATASQIERLLSGGARAYLTKPLDVTEFLHALDTMLPEQKADDSSCQELSTAPSIRGSEKPRSENRPRFAERST